MSEGGSIIKKLLFFICIYLIIYTNSVYASNNDAKARIGNNFYDSLEDAIMNASSTDIINLTKDIMLDNTLGIKKTVNINLNGNDIVAKEKVFFVKGGSLNISGKGTIKESMPYYGAIVIEGSKEQNDKNYSTVSVGSEVTLEGWSGIFIDHYDKKAYGILVNMDGSINAINDIDGGEGAGIYVNGNIQHEDNHPIINLGNTVKITSTGNGIYAAGYATYNINGAYISGVQSGLGIKSGIFNILDATIIGTGKDETPTSGNNNGINASGTAIQIESNPGYKGDIELNIKTGTITSENSYVIYEYTVNNSQTKIKSIDISGGTYKSNAKKNVFSLSDSLKNTHPKFITGGTYSSDPTTYLNNGYEATLNNNMYNVTTSTMQVFLEKDNQTTNTFGIILIISAILIIGIIIFFKKKQIII